MKTLTILIAAAAASLTINANAYNVDDLTIGEVFPVQSITYQESADSVSTPNELVWGGENEGYILNSIVENSIASALQELENNPPAAGRSSSRSVFIYNDTAGEYHLQ